QTYLVVAAYTRGSGARDGGEVKLWINPTDLGAAEAPPPILTMPSYEDVAVWNRVTIRSNGSGSHPKGWAIDEVRIGTTWASVTPTSETRWIPEPGTYAALLGAGVLSLHFLRRRQRQRRGG